MSGKYGWNKMLLSTKIFLIGGIIFWATVVIPFSVFVIYMLVPASSPPSGFAWTRYSDFNGFYNIGRGGAGHELAMPTDRDMRILMISDLHLQFIGDGRTLRHVDRLVYESDPDLIVLMGDNVGYLLNNNALRRLINRMDSYEIPWAAVIGNHDERGKATRNRIAHMLGDTHFGMFLYGPNCLRTFSGNYFINLVRPRGAGQGGTEIVHTLYMVGSGMGPLTRHRYPNPPDDQVDWFEWAVRGNYSLRNIDGVSSTIMVHTPFREFERAYYYGQVLFPGNHEGIWAPDDTSNFFNRILELNYEGVLNLVNIFAAHDHFNYFSALYHGIQMTYTLHSGYGWASHESLPWIRRQPVRGGTLLLVNPDSGATRKQHLFTSRGPVVGLVDIPCAV